jgi:hypothetical protein
MLINVYAVRTGPVSPGTVQQIMTLISSTFRYNSSACYISTTRPRYAASARTAQQTSLPLLRIRSLPGKRSVHRTVP